MHVRTYICIMKLEDALQTTKFESIQHKALLNIMYTAYWAKAQINVVLKKHDLTSEQFNVMRILKGKHPEAMCVKDISSRMIETSSNVPRIIDRMILKGTANRTQSATDKRETLVSLTQKGLTQLQDTNIEVKKFNKIKSLTDADALMINDLLERLRNEA